MVHTCRLQNFLNDFSIRFVLSLRFSSEQAAIGGEVRPVEELERASARLQVEQRQTGKIAVPNCLVKARTDLTSGNNQIFVLLDIENEICRAFRKREPVRPEIRSLRLKGDIALKAID